MDRSNSNSSSDEQAAEKKMKVDLEDVDTEMTPVDCPDIVQPSPPETTVATSDSSNGAGNNHGQEDKILSSAETKTQCVASTTTTEDDAAVVSSDLGKSEVVDSTTTEEEAVLSEEDVSELVELKVVFNKQQLKIKMSLKKTVGDLKRLIEKETKVAPELQKVVLKGIPKDDVRLETLGVTRLTKIMVIGTTLSDVMAISTKPTDQDAHAAEDVSTGKDAANWCSLTQHKKVIDKGVPLDAMPGILNEAEPLPEIPLFGMLNSKGGKVRLTFKLELDELWIGTKERTEKVPMGSIRNVESQTIPGYEHYHIVAIQLGPTVASRYFVYWVPAQYIQAIKDALEN